MKELCFPVIIIKEKDPSIYFFSKNAFGLASIGGEKFYKDGTLYDANGSVFQINGVKSVNPASLLESLKFFQRMKKVTPDLQFRQRISLPEFKEILITHIQDNSGYWARRDLIEDIISAIRAKNGYKEIMTFIE